MDTGLIQTEAELVELTGYKLPSKQRQALDSMGIKYIVRRDGHIRTTRPWLSLVQSSPAQEDANFNLGALG